MYNAEGDVVNEIEFRNKYMTDTSSLTTNLYQDRRIISQVSSYGDNVDVTKWQYNKKGKVLYKSLTHHSTVDDIAMNMTIEEFYLYNLYNDLIHHKIRKSVTTKTARYQQDSLVESSVDSIIAKWIYLYNQANQKLQEIRILEEVRDTINYIYSAKGKLVEDGMYSAPQQHFNASNQLVKEEVYLEDRLYSRIDYSYNQSVIATKRKGVYRTHPINTLHYF